MTTPQEYERRAKEGDVDAQYALAAILAQRGRGDLATEWLRRAASGGHADALFTLACRILSVTEGAKDRRGDVVAALNEARAKGSLAALRMIAALTAAGFIDGDGWPAALSLIEECCARGEAAAKRELGVLLLDADAEDADGTALLFEASAEDRLATALIRRRLDRGLATRQGRYSLARALEKVARDASAAQRQEICATPRVYAYRQAIGADLCDHLIGAAAPRLKREYVLGADGVRRLDPHRTAWGALLGFGFADLPAVRAGQRMAQLAGIPYAHGEPLSILNYKPGQEYRVHHDFLSPADPDLVAHGQRQRTALLYLNEGYVGGETHFVVPDIKFAGGTGDVLVFHNVDESGATDYGVRHAGLGVTQGEKWLASLWLRDRPFLD